MIELVIFVIILNIIFEMLNMIYPTSKLSNFIRSSLSILLVYLICIKIKTVFGS